MENDSTKKPISLTAAYRAPTEKNPEHSFQYFNPKTMKMYAYRVSGLWGDLVGLSDGDQVKISISPRQEDGTPNFEINPILNKNILD